MMKFATAYDRPGTPSIIRRTFKEGKMISWKKLLFNLHKHHLKSSLEREWRKDKFVTRRFLPVPSRLV